MKLITVAIPAYNRPHLLRCALESVRRQTFREFDVLISDNASTDDLYSIVSEFFDLNIKHVRHEKSLGAAGNWRYVLEAPETPLVAWLHADDEWKPDHLARAVSAFKDNPSAVLYSCAVEHFSDDHIVEIQKLNGYEDVDSIKLFQPEQSLCFWLYRLMGQCSSHVFRREALIALWWGPKNLFYRLDYLLIGQMLCRGVWIYDPICSARFRVGRDNGGMAGTSGECRFQGVQSAYVTRYIIRTAFSRGLIDEERILVQLKKWNDLQIGGLVAALCAFGADRRLRSFGGEIIRRYPSAVYGNNVARSCLVARYCGLWVLSFSDYINRLRVRWWPRGNIL